VAADDRPSAIEHQLLVAGAFCLVEIPSAPGRAAPQAAAEIGRLHNRNIGQICPSVNRGFTLCYGVLRGATGCYGVLRASNVAPCGSEPAVKEGTSVPAAKSWTACPITRDLGVLRPRVVP
jgi:hypothetical protein